MPLLWMLFNCKGQLMITTRRRLWIFSPGKVLINAGVIVLTAIALMYPIMLGLKVKQSEAATEKIGSATNVYMNKNSAQIKRRRQIQLLASTLIEIAPVNRSSPADPNGSFRIIREPYPTIKEVEKRLGAADLRETKGRKVHLIWNHRKWQKPSGWPGGSVDQAWPCTVTKVMEAWFNEAGLMDRMAIAPKADGAGMETIGRSFDDWTLAP